MPAWQSVLLPWRQAMEKIMTGSTQEYLDYILELLEPINMLSSGRFFGGIGLKADTVQFAMVMGNSLFFVVDDSSRPKYEARGMGCFWYNTKKKKVNVRKYYEVPGDLLEDQAALVEWAKESIRIAAKLKKK